MGGFLGALSFLAPVGQTLGPAMEQGAREAQAQRSRDAFGKMLGQLGPEYEPFRQWFNAGGQEHEISAGIGGPIGASLRQQHETEITNQIMNDPKLTPEQRNQQLFVHHAISGSDYLKSLTGAKPADEFEHYITNVKGSSLEAYRALPDKERQSWYDDFLQEQNQAKLQLAQDKPQLRVVKRYNPDTGRNENVVEDISKVPPGTSMGEPAKSRQEISSIQSVTAARSMLGNLKDKIQAEGAKRTAAQAYNDYYLHYKLGRASTSPERDHLITQLGGTLQILLQAASASGNVRAYQYLQSFQSHFPQYWDEDKLALDKIDQLTMKGGILDTFGKMMEVPETGGSAEEGGGANDADDSDFIGGFTPNGRF